MVSEMKLFKSTEQKLFEAFNQGKGVKLTAQDVERLLLTDDAIRVRISNVAATEAGVPEPGCDCMCIVANTWAKFKKMLKETA